MQGIKGARLSFLMVQNTCGQKSLWEGLYYYCMRPLRFWTLVSKQVMMMMLLLLLLLILMTMLMADDIVQQQGCLK